MNKICSNSVAEHHHSDKSSSLDRILDLAGKLATDLLKLLINKHCFSPAEEDPTDLAYTKQVFSTVEALGNLVHQTVDLLPDQTSSDIDAYPNATAAALESLMRNHATFHSLHQELPGSFTVLPQSQQLLITPPTTPVDGSLSVV